MSIEKIIDSISELAPFPLVIEKVATLLKDEDYDTTTVAETVKLDASLTANILRISNSAHYGGGGRIQTIQQAISFLGRKNIISSLQLAAAVKYYRDASGGYVEKAIQLWEHTVAVALMSQILSRRILGKEDQIIYTAALLHDIGKVVMGQYVKDSIASIYRLVEEGNRSFLEAEEEVVGINHAFLGGKVARHWKFSDSVVDAIAYHHRPDLLAAKDDALAWLVYLADQACLIFGVDGGMDGLAHRGLGEVKTRFNLQQRDLEESMIQLWDEIKKAKELIGMGEYK